MRCCGSDLKAIPFSRAWSTKRWVLASSSVPYWPLALMRLASSGCTARSASCMVPPPATI